MINEMFGPYRLESLVGQGGMGEVYRAADTRKRDRVVALKRLPLHMSADPKVKARFRREADIASRLTEPHVIPIHDYGEIDGQLYIDMRFVSGRDLSRAIVEAGRLDVQQIVSIIDQIADALDAAHAENLVHRDVKPSNILLTGSSNPSFAYLIDFGIAHILDDTRLTTSVGPETVAYKAPERFDGDDDNPVSDVYSLACVLFEGLTGVRAFHAQSHLGYMRAHCLGPRPRLSDECAELSLELDAVIRQGLATDPRERFQTAGALARAARAAVYGQQARIDQQPEAPTVLLVGRSPGEGMLPPITQGPADDTRLQARDVFIPSGSGTAGTAPSTPTRRGIRALWRRLDKAGQVTVSLTLVVTSAILGIPFAVDRLSSPAIFSVAATVLGGQSVYVTGDQKGGVQVRELRSGDSLGGRLVSDDGYVRTVAASVIDNRPVVISSGFDRRINIWDTQTGERIGAPLVGHDSPVVAVVADYLDDRPVLVSASLDGTILLWDLSAGAGIGSPIRETGSSMSGQDIATVHLNGRLLVVAVNEMGVVAWDALTGTLVLGGIDPGLSSYSAVESAEIDGRPVVVSGDADGSIEVWDLATGGTLGPPWVGHAGPVNAVYITELDSRTVVVSGGSDSSVRVWDLRTGESLVRPLTGHIGSVESVSAAGLDDRPVVISGSSDGTVRLWDLRTGDLVGAPRVNCPWFCVR